MRSILARRLARAAQAPRPRQVLLPTAAASPYATLSPHTPPPTTPYEVFDEPSKARQRDRAIRRLKQSRDPDAFQTIDYLREELAERLAERVEDLKTPPKSVLDLSAHAGQLTKVLQEILPEDEGRQWWMAESSRDALYRDADSDFSYPPTRVQVGPSEMLSHPGLMPLREHVEAIVSAGGLHWVGDIVGAFTQIRHLLKPDGVFIGALLGGDTLFELRTSLQLAEQERRGGIANRVSPMINPTDAPSLLNRAGFTLTTVDVEDLTIRYPSIWELMADLRDMGESNAILGRRPFIARDVLLAAEGIYNELYGSDAEEGVPATFQIIYFIGWKPGPNQPQPLERGSGQTSLKDVL